MAGRLYQVEHSKGFDNPDWDGIDGTILGAGDIHSINIPVDAVQHRRFFRVRLLR